MQLRRVSQLHRVSLVGEPLPQASGSDRLRSGRQPRAAGHGRGCLGSQQQGAPAIKGTFSIEVKHVGTWVAYQCARSLPTRTGVDLPDGTYRVTAVADGPNGPITTVEEVSFP